MPDADLERFHDGYRRHFDDALAEINGGRKTSHWMWFIFPQVAGLGTSPTAGRYAIRDRAEADAFVQDPVLGPGYRTLFDAIWRQAIGGGLSLRTLRKHRRQRWQSVNRLLDGPAGRPRATTLRERRDLPSQCGQMPCRMAPTARSSVEDRLGTDECRAVGALSRSRPDAPFCPLAASHDCRDPCTCRSSARHRGSRDLSPW